jgi:hypothetical protein
MRFRRALAVATASAVTAAGGVAAVVLAGPAAAATITSVGLPFPTYSQMLIDPVHQHLFVTAGPGSSSILVTDYSGHTVATVPNEPGATGLALSSDGSTVYAALANGDAISAISTSTLAETARYGTGTGTDPTYVAYTSGKIWFGYGAVPTYGVGSIDPGTTPATVTLNATNDPVGTWIAAPELTAAPTGDLVAGLPGISGLQLASYDVSSGSATTLAPLTRFNNYASLASMQITPDGKDVVVATGGGTYNHTIFQVSDLSLAGDYPTGPFTATVSVASDGTVAAGTTFPGAPGSEVYLFAPGGSTPLAIYNLGSHPLIGTALSPDDSELFAVTLASVTVTPPSGGRPPSIVRHYALNIISNPVPSPSPAVTGVSPGSGPSAGGNTVTLTGTGFTGASAVSFGTVPATSFTVNSDTSITATVPAGTVGIDDVTVTTPGGTSPTSPADQYVYHPTCTTTITGTNATQLTVTSGLTCLVNATQSGHVTVAAGAALSVTNSSINGTVTATSPSGITFCGSTEDGTLSVTGATGPVILGGTLADGTACAADTIPSSIAVTAATAPVTVTGLQQNGTLTLESDTAGVTLDGSHLNGRAYVDNNTATAPAVITVSGNTVTGSLYCTGNNPAPDDNGSINTVSGTATDQCAAIAQR